MELCNSFLGSPDPHARKAAVAALGVMSEGCAEPIKARLSEILPKILEVCTYVLFPGWIRWDMVRKGGKSLIVVSLTSIALVDERLI